jgi:hypothetical protein
VFEGRSDDDREVAAPGGDLSRRLAQCSSGREGGRGFAGRGARGGEDRSLEVLVEQTLRMTASSPVPRWPAAHVACSRAARRTGAALRERDVVGVECGEDVLAEEVLAVDVAVPRDRHRLVLDADDVGVVFAAVLIQRGLLLGAAAGRASARRAAGRPPR